MSFLKVKFPHEEEYEFESGKPIVILGANGAGKTRLGVKIEELNDPQFLTANAQSAMPIHRISAQKSLSIGETISILDYESAQRDLFIGGAALYACKNRYRYGDNPATHLLDDFNKALSLLFSEESKELQEAHKKDKQAVEDGMARPELITTVVEKTTQIWNSLLPHRGIDLSGSGVHVMCGEQRYHGKEMSDGERVMLYMIAQIMVQRPNTLIIIDEPELHIHKSIVAKFWTLLESARNDCVFMYITHDLDFALSRNEAKILWVKSFNGQNWDYEFLNGSEFENIPESLLLEIIGTRQKVLFVEGTKDSYDYQLYQKIYEAQGYHIIPCGGCQEVIRLTKAKRTYEKLNSIEVYGIIDRDFRTATEINALKDDGIYCLDVAEVENLFIVPEVLDIMERVLVCNEGTAKTAKEFILSKFEQEKDQQINLALAQEMKYQLSLFELGKQKLTSREIKEIIDEKFSEEKIELIRTKRKSAFDSAQSLKEILAVLNLKGLSSQVGSIFGMKSQEYPKRILNVLNRQLSEKEELLEAIKKYTPEIS